MFFLSGCDFPLIALNAKITSQIKTEKEFSCA